MTSGEGDLVEPEGVHAGAQVANEGDNAERRPGPEVTTGPAPTNIGQEQGPSGEKTAEGPGQELSAGEG
jgi:hypothetical protein